MIRWLIQGIVRDKTRFLFPFIVVGVGVALMITMLGFMDGIFMSMVETTSILDTGHLRLVNKAYYDEEHLNPMDRALGGQKATGKWLEEHSGTSIQWLPRIRWGAILDVPDEQGETLSQTPIQGMAMDLSSASPEIERLKLQKSLVQGSLPQHRFEMLIGYQLAETLDLQPGDSVTLIGQSFDGGLASDNYKVTGLIRFGVFAMDKKMALIDLKDAQDTFYMEDMVTEWLGFFPSRVAFQDYGRRKMELEPELKALKSQPPAGWYVDDDPILLTILEQRNMDEMAKMFLLIRGILLVIFTFLMVLVLWNAALLNGIHRYGEMGLRLALGETHIRLVGLAVFEALVIGCAGALAGSLLGGGLVWYLQEVGVDMGDAFAQSGMMLTDVMRGRLSLEGFVYGIVPGLAASALGTLCASFAIFKRSEANLFREMEV